MFKKVDWLFLLYQYHIIKESWIASHSYSWQLFFRQDLNWLAHDSKPIIVTEKPIVEAVVVDSNFLEKEIYNPFCQD